MCAMFTDEPAGNPPRVTANVAVAAVMLPAESLVVLKVIVAVPDTVDSALVTGGTSLAGDSNALKIGLAAVDGAVVVVVDDELPHPAANRATARASADRRFIVKLSF